MDVYAIKVTLLGIDPPVWRRVLVRRNITLHQLHKTLQTVMGWTNSHLHQFIFRRQKYSDLDFGLGPGILDERRTLLGELISTPGTKLLYEYDLGDGWLHELLLEEILVGDESFRQTCVQGARNNPPEDCGGPHGFAELLKAVSDVSHPEHDDFLAWLGGDFDPEYFRADEINRKLRRRKS